MKLKTLAAIGCLSILFFVSCLDQAGSSGESATPQAKTEVENLADLNYPTVLQPGETGEMTLGVRGVPGEALYYTITKSDPSSKVIPSTGIIIISDQNRQVFSSITAGSQQGLKTFTVKLTDSQGKETFQSFDISVQN